MSPKVVKTEQEWREELTPEQYDVLRRQGTEPPFTGRYVALETRQKATNASATLPTISPWESTPAAAGAATTSTFFAHCLGRNARRSARPDGTTGAGLGSVRGSEVSSPSATRGLILRAPARSRTHSLSSASAHELMQ